MSDTKTLYDFSQELRDFMANIEADPETGEIDSETGEKIDQLYEDFEDKTKDCVNYLRRTVAEAELAKAESDKIKIYAKTLENKVKWMADYIQEMMKSVGIKKVVVSGRPATIAKNPMSVEVDMSQLDIEWTKEKISVDPDKKALLRYIKDGNEVPIGVTVIDDKTSLRY